MDPAKLDLPTIWRGCIWPDIIFTWKDGAGEPFDLNGWTPVVKSRNINLNPVVTDRSGGEVTLSLTGNQTSALRLGVEKWNWIWIDSYGKIYPPFFFGSIEIKEQVFVQPVTQ